MRLLIKLLFFIFNFSIYSKIYISDSIKLYFNNDPDRNFKSLTNLIDVFTEDNYFPDPGNFLLVELKYNENDKKYICNEDGLNLEIIVNDDNTMTKNFKFKDKRIFQEYKYKGYHEHDEGSLFKITVKNNSNNIKSYYIYSTKLGMHNIYNRYFCVSLENNENIIEFETIYCFGINIVDDFFKNCKNLKKVKFTNYNKNKENEIKDFISFHRLFEGCDNLEDVNIENLIITGAENMFKDCKKLKNIKFNNSLNNLEFCSTFENCENLENIDFTNPEKNNIIISSNSFKNCKKLKNINVDYLYVFNYFKNCFQNCKNLKKLKLVIDESKFSQPYFQAKEGKIPDQNTNNYLEFDDSTKNTNLEELEIVTKDNFELTEDNKNHIKKIVKNNKMNKFTLNGKSIKVENGCNLDGFISNPDGYLNDNPQFIWKDTIPYIPNIDNKINTEDIKGSSCLLCCCKCCSKCCKRNV